MITTVVTKALKRKEVELGFLHIPVKNRFELLGENIAPFDTKLNNFPAKVDKQGRLWCSELLKNKFPINAEVDLSKNENGFLVTLNGKHEPIATKKAPDFTVTEKKKENNSFSELLNAQNLDTTSHKVLEGDCIKYLNEGAIGAIDLSFFDPPYLQGKEYRFFDDKQSDEKYWGWIEAIIEGIYKDTSDGGAIYFMHREKNAERVLQISKENRLEFSKPDHLEKEDIRCSN